VERAERRGRNGRHEGVPQPFRGTNRANGDRSRSQLVGGTRDERNGGKRARKNGTLRTWGWKAGLLAKLSIFG